MELNKIVYLSEAQKNALFESEASNPGHGSITVDGQTVAYSSNDLYITPETNRQSIVYKGTVTLHFNEWSVESPYTQVVQVTGQAIQVTGATINANTKVDIQPDAEVLTKLINDGVQALYIENDSGTLIVHSIGGRPVGESSNDDITLQVTFYDTF